MVEQRATLGGGCFWCVEAVYLDLQGVGQVVSGYAGGHVENPSYDEVCAKTTGHAEVIQVSFDDALISYQQLLQVFFTVHDPTTKDRQGNDVGPQYRSIILTHDDEQRRVAEGALQEAQAAWDEPIVTEIVPFTKFWPGEDYHQDYYRQNKLANPYCTFVVRPKVNKFRKKWAHLLKST